MRISDWSSDVCSSDLKGIFAADVDIAMRRADGMGRDSHPLDQAERIAFHQHAIRKGAAVALIGIADDIFGGARRIEHGLPLDPGRKACAAEPAQAACLVRKSVG